MMRHHLPIVKVFFFLFILTSGTPAGLSAQNVLCPPDFTVISNNPPLLLTGGFPPGGTYNGPGVLGGNLFDPSFAGPGVHALVYIAELEPGVFDACTFMATVAPMPVPAWTEGGPVLEAGYTGTGTDGRIWVGLIEASGLPLRLLYHGEVPPALNGISVVDFQYSPDSLMWMVAGIDISGDDILVPGPVPMMPGLVADGWTVVWFPPGGGSTAPEPWYFRAVITFGNGLNDTVYMADRLWVDPTPPSALELSISDWHQTTESVLTVTVAPGGSNPDSIWAGCPSKVDHCYSLVTPQLMPSQAQAAGAAASAFGGLAATGYPAVMGGLSQQALADSLAAMMQPDSLSGTAISQCWSAVKAWGRMHGDFFLYSDDRLEVYFDPAYTYSTTFDTADWRRMRDGFEHGDAVIVTASWPDGGMLHSRFFTLFSNENKEVYFDLRLADPLSGQVIEATMNAADGGLLGFRDTLGNPLSDYPPLALISSYLIMSPKAGPTLAGLPFAGSGSQPLTIGFALPDTGLYWLRVHVADADGNRLDLYRVVQRLADSTAILPGNTWFTLDAGVVLRHPFGHGDYLSAADSLIRLNGRGSMPGDTADFWDFYYSTDSLSWTLLGSDSNGNALPAPGPMAAASEHDGWSAWLNTQDVAPDADRLYFKANIHMQSGLLLEVVPDRSWPFDHNPPEMAEIVFDGLEYDAAKGFWVCQDEVFSLDVNPGGADLSESGYAISLKPGYFAKGIPPLAQPGLADCGPSALAACLSWFAQEGDPGIMAGLSVTQLIDTLRKISETHPVEGTWDDDLAHAARWWLGAHGLGYSVRHITMLGEGQGGQTERNWSRDNWEQMRSELESGQNVIPLFNWVNADGSIGGHFMTMNSVNNIQLPNGNYQVDFMDPAYGEIVEGELDPATGVITGYVNSQGVTYPPDSATITSYIIICPAAFNPLAATTVMPGTDPAPQTAALPGEGLYWLKVVSVDAQGHSAYKFFPIEYVDPTLCPEDLSVTLDSDPFPLWPVAKEEGTFNGPGIVADLFFPAYAGTGDHVVSYTRQTAGGISISCSFSIRVLADTVGLLAIGPYVDPSSSLDWISPGEGSTGIRLLAPADSLDKVMFSPFPLVPPATYRFDRWNGCSTDSSGTAYGATGPLVLSSANDGWAGSMHDSLLAGATLTAPLWIMAQLFRPNDTVMLIKSVKNDPSPPASVNLSIEDWYSTAASSFYLHLDPVLANLSEVVCKVVAKPDSFAKGVPPIEQPGLNDCGPTALAACFKWFAAQGDGTIVGALTNAALIDSLRKYSGAADDEPLSGDQLAAAAKKWLEKHGSGYEVRDLPYIQVDEDGNETNSFDEEAFKKMRDELEKGQDVITLFNWVEDGDTLGHYMTFNSIVNRKQDNGTYRVDFMDPSSGEIIYGDLDPANGSVTGFTNSDGDVYPPNGSVITENIIICPKKTGGGGSSSAAPPTEVVVSPPDSILISLPQPGLYWIHLELTDLDGHYAEIDRIVERVQEEHSLEGFLTYDNSLSSPIGSVIVALLQNGDTLAVDTTASDGSYSFEELPAGNYQLRCSRAGNWGGANAIDALLILRHFTGISYLSGLREQAADLQLSGFVNAADALEVTKRFTGLVSGFLSGDYLFEQIDLSLNGGGLVNQNIKGICYGDVNGSFVP